MGKKWTEMARKLSNEELIKEMRIPECFVCEKARQILMCEALARILEKIGE